MNGFLNKNLKSYAKNWLAPVKYAEMRSKNAVRNQYTNLYAYAANNPVKYVDPDGRTDNLPFVRAEANGNNVKYYREDGSGVERSGGSRAWRNNNPGNIRNATYAIGSAGGFAVFADYDTGYNAIIDLLTSDNYINLTIFDAISRYAPPNEIQLIFYKSKKKSSSLTKNKNYRANAFS